MTSFASSWKRFFASSLSLAIAILLPLAGVSASHASAVALTIEHAGWNVVGLDSNDVTSGPNQFPEGATVCNTSSDTDATGVEITWNWTSANAFISLDGSSTKSLERLTANTCKTVWWTVQVARNSAAYDTSRTFTISANDDAVATAVTGTELVYVEHLVSQNRNVVNSVTASASVTLGSTVQFVLSGKTATQGYEQVVTAPVLDSSIFEVISVVGTYNVGGSVSNFYFDACGWDPAGTSRLNWNCLGSGKAGGDPITVTVTAKVIGTGSASVGGIIYDFSGSSFHYNSDFTSSIQAVTASVPTPAITATNDSASTGENTAVEVDVTANDTATDGIVDPTSVTQSLAPAHGTISIDSASGKITYTPDTGYNGTDTFKYTVCTTEAPATCSEATVNIEISAPVGSPTINAENESETTGEDTPVEVDVTANDIVTDGTLNPASVTESQAPSHGTISVDPVSGKITYSPESGYTGTDSFKYTVCTVEDAKVCDEAQVDITISSAQDPVAIDAVDDSASTEIDTDVIINIPSNDAATNGSKDVTSVTVTVAAGHGSVSIDPATGVATYSPESGYTGTDTFKYRICTIEDGKVCDEATVTLTISDVEQSGTEQNPKENTASVLPEEKLSIDPDSLDPSLPDIDPTTIEVIEQPTHGNASVDPVSGVITYVPETGFTGTVTLKLKLATFTNRLDSTS